MSDYNRQKALKKMAELLRSGATMLKESCPICGLPLFKLKSGEVVCPIHGPIKVVSSEAEAISAVTESVLNSLEKIISRKINDIIMEVAQGNEDLLDYAKYLRELIDLLERIRRVKSFQTSASEKRS